MAEKQTPRADATDGPETASASSAAASAGSKKMFMAVALTALVIALVISTQIFYGAFFKDATTTVEIRGHELQQHITRVAPPLDVEDSEVFVVVETMPQLVGGLASIQSMIRYPEVAKKAGIQGKVFVQFVVDSEGSVKNATIVRGIGGGCDEEALRAVLATKWVPGKQRGRDVSVKMSLPVSFVLDKRNVR